MLGWAALSLLPDADVIGFALGVEYADPWGHRGATHSLVVALAAGLAIGAAARWFNRPAAATAVLATAVLASHGVLDTMTDGGLGCALLWPFDLTRYFAPWRPIPVAPIGLAFFSSHGAMIALTEAVLFSPVLLFALPSRPGKARSLVTGSVLALWIVSLWLISSGDRIRESLVGVVLREDTAYASGFSEAAFRSIAPGASHQEVRRLVGAPLGENWVYAPGDPPFEPAATRAAAAVSNACQALRFEAGAVVAAFDPDSCRKLGIDTGASAADVERLLGSPSESCWLYSRSPRRGHYRLRMVCFTNARVETVIRRWE
jgi:inner membrane protein